MINPRKSILAGVMARASLLANALTGRAEPRPIVLAGLPGGPALATPRAIADFRPRADVANPAEILASLQRTFEEFKAANDDRIKALETGRGDVLSAEKVDRINSDLTALSQAMDDINRRLAANALNGSGGTGTGHTDPRMASAGRGAYAAAFSTAFRKGGDDDTLKALSIQAAMQTQSDPDGGWMVPVEIETTIDRVLATVSAMRSVASVRTISTGQYKKLVSQGGAGAGWVGETEGRPQTGTPQLAEIAIEAMELYANPFATQTLLDDAFVDIGAWLADEVSISFSEQEGAAFVSGNGVKKPRGILGYTAVADANYAWGKIGYIGTGGAGFAADPAGMDTLISALYALKMGYRRNASFLANRKTIGVLRTMKDSQGHYQWQPSTQAGEPATLLGYPIVDDDNMDDLGASKYPIAVADFKRAYLIVDRIGVRVLRDPYSNKPYVSFYTTKRVGGGVQNFEAIKLVKCA